MHIFRNEINHNSNEVSEVEVNNYQKAYVVYESREIKSSKSEIIWSTRKNISLPNETV